MTTQRAQAKNDSTVYPVLVLVWTLESRDLSLSCACRHVKQNTPTMHNDKRARVKSDSVCRVTSACACRHACRAETHKRKGSSDESLRVHVLSSSLTRLHRCRFVRRRSGRRSGAVGESAAPASRTRRRRRGVRRPTSGSAAVLHAALGRRGAADQIFLPALVLASDLALLVASAARAISSAGGHTSEGSDFLATFLLKT